jgi:hypothetical protein
MAAVKKAPAISGRARSIAHPLTIKIFMGRACNCPRLTRIINLKL